MSDVVRTLDLATRSEDFDAIVQRADRKKCVLDIGRLIPEVTKDLKYLRFAKPIPRIHRGIYLGPPRASHKSMRFFVQCAPGILEDFLDFARDHQSVIRLRCQEKTHFRRDWLADEPAKPSERSALARCCNRKETSRSVESIKRPDGGKPIV